MLALSIVLPHYNNWTCVARHLEMRAALPATLLEKTELLLVDDGSTEERRPPLPPNTVLVRIHDNIPWNQGGARNLGVHLAKAEWLLVSDIDHFFPAKTLEAILALKKDKNRLYRLARRHLNGKERKPHGNTFVIRKSRFEAIGGMDEDFGGAYGFLDTDFNLRWKKTKKEIVTLDGVYCLSGGHYRGAEGTLSRDKSRNAVLLATKKANGAIDWKPGLRFRWSITDHNECERSVPRPSTIRVALAKLFRLAKQVKV